MGPGPRQEGAHPHLPGRSGRFRRERLRVRAHRTARRHDRPRPRRVLLLAAAAADGPGVRRRRPGGAYDHTFTQAMPAVSSAPGGYRVVWSDARGHYANSPDTPEGALAYRLYVALVPTVSVRASRKTLGLGGSVTVTTRVSPAFFGLQGRAAEGQAAHVRQRVRRARVVRRVEDRQGQDSRRRQQGGFLVDAPGQGHLLDPCLVQGRQEVRGRGQRRPQGASRAHDQRDRQARRQVTRVGREGRSLAAHPPLPRGPRLICLPGPGSFRASPLRRGVR